MPSSPERVVLTPGLPRCQRGRKILVRLRPPFSPDTFLLEDDVVQTMLHEVMLIIISSLNFLILNHIISLPIMSTAHTTTKFYKYLSGLQDEYDDLQRSGSAGEGFFSAGHRLGTNVSHNVPPNVARIKALEAAEKRVKMQRALNGGGRLGGRSRKAGLSPRELAARVSNCSPAPILPVDRVLSGRRAKIKRPKIVRSWCRCRARG